MPKLDVETFNKTCKMHEKRVFYLKHTTNYKVFEYNFMYVVRVQKISTPENSAQKLKSKHQTMLNYT